MHSIVQIYCKHVLHKLYSPFSIWNIHDFCSKLHVPALCFTLRSSLYVSMGLNDIISRAFQRGCFRGFWPWGDHMLRLFTDGSDLPSRTLIFMDNYFATALCIIDSAACRWQCAPLIQLIHWQNFFTQFCPIPGVKTSVHKRETWLKMLVIYLFVLDKVICLLLSVLPLFLTIIHCTVNSAIFCHFIHPLNYI